MGRTSPKKQFKIDKMDHMGQGVSRSHPKVAFIAKTLPGEEGVCSILKESKKVQFGSLSSLDDLAISSPKRIPSPCPHFMDCPSCHFLHTDYESELQFKRQVLAEHFHREKIPVLENDIQMIRAPQRLYYRNRLQLHYDLDQKRLGYIDPLRSQIVEVPACLIGRGPLQLKLKELYANEYWIKLAQDQGGHQFPRKGHLEIIINPSAHNSVQLVWNSSYSHGGFTQVNEEMNTQLKELVKGLIRKHLGSKQLVGLDLFGGNGNLSQILDPAKILVLDKYTGHAQPDSHSHKFIDFDLYQSDIGPKLKNLLLNEGIGPLNFILLDPPRSGFKELSMICESLTPEFVLYVSCGPSTMVRDLASLTSYTPVEVFLVDLFPSTFHFETVIALKRK